MFAFSSVIPTSLNIFILLLSVVLWYILYSLNFLTRFLFWFALGRGKHLRPVADRSGNVWKWNKTAAAVAAGFEPCLSSTWAKQLYRDRPAKSFSIIWPNYLFNETCSIWLSVTYVWKVSSLQNENSAIIHSPSCRSSSEDKLRYFLSNPIQIW